MISDRVTAWLRLAMVRGIGPMTGRRLVQASGGIERLWSQSPQVLKTVDGIGPQFLTALGQDLDQAVESVVELCRQREIGLLCPDDRSHCSHSMMHCCCCFFRVMYAV